MIKAIALFAIGLVLLIFGGDWFVDGASGIAKRFHLPELLIGATVVSIGTTLPEVMVSATSAFTGHGEIAYGNAIGSIICNTSLIAALSIAAVPNTVNKKTLVTPVAFFFFANIIYALTAYIGGRFTRLCGLVLLLIFVVYMFITVRQAFKSNDVPGKDDTPEKDDPFVKSIVLLVLGAAMIAVGAKLLVDNGTILAKSMGVPESVIALTFVALGTSLPELITAITSLIKGHGLLSLGNIIGANLFNIVLVSGLATTISPFDIPAEKLIAGMNASKVIDIPLSFIVMGILCVPALLTGKLKRWQGILLLVIYAAFCAFQFAF